MGFIGNAISSILGTEPAPTIAPMAVEEEAEEVTGEEAKLKKLRSALTATSGGLAGEEVMSTSRRSGLFGN